MFVRFVVRKLDKDSHEPQGVIHAAAELSRAGGLASHEQVVYDEIRAWFHKHLDRPTRFARASGHNPAAVAVSWFKSSAHEHIARARQLALILEDHNLLVSQLVTDRPGYVVYEDEFQIAAEPFRNDR